MGSRSGLIAAGSGPVLETERLRLRVPQARDFDAYAEMNFDEEAMRFIGGTLPRAAAWRKFLQMPGAWALQGFAMFTVETREGEWLGQLGPWQPEGWPGTEVGWAFKRAAWGRGYATEAAVAAIDWAFDTLGWTDVIHSISPDNLASQLLAQRLGSVNRGPGSLPAPFAGERIDIWGQTREQWLAPERCMSEAVTVYGMKASGNCYKLALLLGQLGRPYRWVEVDSVNGQTRTPEFLAKNANGKVPLLELADGRRLAESNAILCYLADGSDFLPADPWLRAQVLQWLFFEQYSHEPYVAVARFVARWLPADHPRQAELPRLRERGHQALAVMEQQLAGQDFLVACGYSVADIALYAYTHEAPVGGILLDDYPAIRAWLARVESRPGFVPQAY